jgi:orotate phosphoribosyltransferase
MEENRLDKKELGQKVYSLSHLTGSFKLRSGTISNEYFDKYQFEADPETLKEIALHMTGLVPENTGLLAGLELGGVPVATALSMNLGRPMALVRKKAKEYGTCKLAEGPDVKGKQVCVVEDVVTTGGQIIESAGELRKLGATVENVLCVIAREEKAFTNLKQAGLNLTALFTMDELKRYG